MTELVLPDSDFSRHFGNLAALRNDLQTVHDHCARIASGELASNSLPWVIDAVGTTVLVRYARCFGRGEDWRRIPADVEAGLPAELAQWHRRFLLLRDLHYAHALGLSEVPLAMTRVDASGGTLVPVAVGCTAVGQCCIYPDWAAALLEVITYFLPIVDERMEIAQREARALVEGFSQEELRALAPVKRPALPSDSLEHLDMLIQERRSGGRLSLERITRVQDAS